jgi:TrmH family RNA methyltransferase
METITSRSNPKIKQVRALRQRKIRQEARLFLAEGIRHVGEAVEAGAFIEAIYYAPELLRSEYAQELVGSQAAAGVACYAVSIEVFEGIAEKENPQGILAVVRQPQPRLDDLNPQNFPWGVALITPQDPGNLGAILRTIDAVGASGLILIDSSVDLYHPSAVRASMGTIFWYPAVQASFDEFRAWALRNAYHVYGSSARTKRDYLAAGLYHSPRILLLGSEREGLSDAQRQACEVIVGLPMRGRASSLNLSVAAGVLLYAMLSQSD